MSKHTPGPWSSFSAFGSRGGCFGGDRTTLIAHLPNKMPGETWRKPSEEEANANFRLIDAAPDMLEALTAAEQKLMADGYTGEHPDGVLGKVRAAIAKAEGR